MIGQVVEIEDSLEVYPSSSRTTEGTTFETMLGDMEDKTGEGDIGMIDMMSTIEIEIDQGRDHSQDVIAVIELEVQAIVDLGQDPEPVLIEIE